MINWTRNNSDVVNDVAVCLKGKRLRIYKKGKWIEDTADIISVSCTSTFTCTSTMGYGEISVVTKSGTNHRFQFKDWERFAAARKYLEGVLF